MESCGADTAATFAGTEEKEKKEQAQAEDDEFFQPMHNPQGENEGYRSETGTTLCVRVNLYQLGG